MSENRGNNSQAGMDGSESIFDALRYTGDTQKDIDLSLKTLISILKNNPDVYKLGRTAPTESQSNYAKEKWKYTRGNEYDPRRYTGRGNILDDFENGIKQQLLDSLAGGNFKKGIQGAMNEFTKQFGMDIRNIPGAVGKELTKNALKAFGGDELGKSIRSQAGKLGSQALDSIFKNVKGGDAIVAGLKKVGKGFLSSAESGTAIASGSQGMAMASGGSSALGGQLVSGIAKGAAKFGPWGLLIAGIIVTAVKVLGPAIQGFVDLVKSAGKSFNRDSEMRKKRMENAQKRLEADMNWMAEQPFKILEEAAKRWEDTWDKNLATVGQTQGYDKASVYALYEGYADRLRKDNLAGVINATDIADKLTSVLQSGLSGPVAEEFAYIATKLNAAIPTQDFFGYADVYASIAANALAQGKSQQEALTYANIQLEQFASNLLYSSRELAGGFTTGLKNSESLFKDAVRISQAAKTYNASDISGALTSVSAIIGAVAPDLADSLVSNVVQAAIGGNSSNIVALRSLANINAGNTDFLRKMAEDPQSVFATLFTNLANMQNMSPDNYMEVAEGLADVFGIDKGAFARVDFNYLAQAISSMDVNNRSLQENLELLRSGQTTTSAEQLKAQEINRVILDEGLAYVIDSEAGRMVQEHMWEEQRTNALMQNEYAVSIQGAALQFLEGIRKSMSTLLNFLNPIGFVNKGIANMVQTITESIGNEQDLAEVLRLGAVGSNAKAFGNLTTRGKDLGLTVSLIEMMGGSKGVDRLNKFSSFIRTYGEVGAVIAGGGMPTSGLFGKYYDSRSNTGVDWSSPVSALLTMGNAFKGDAGTAHNSIASRYGWGSVGKSFAQGLAATAMNNNTIAGFLGGGTATQMAANTSNRRFQEFLDTAKEAAKSMSYDDWKATAKSRGISDFAAALDDYGRTEEELKSYFEASEAAAGAQVEASRKADEQAFRDETRAFWDYSGGSNGVFQTAMWLPFFGDGRKYDTRMDIVDTALTNIQGQIGFASDHTVISGIEELSRKLGDDTTFTVIGVLSQIRDDISTTFVSTNSVFQKCLASWTSYIASSKEYTSTVNKASAWSELKNAERDQQTEATLALANALGVFSAEELKKLDPQLQTNVLLGEILVLLQTIMQQNNTTAGGLTLMDTISAMGMGMTFRTGT